MGYRRLIYALVLLAGLAFGTTASAESHGRAASPMDLLVVGVHASPAFSYPILELQRILFAHFALGAMGFYMENSSSDSVNRLKGGLGTLSYYALDNFRGLWVRGGYGLFEFDTRLGNQTESFKKNAWLATIGARGRWEGGVNIGISAGALLIQPFASQLVDFTVSGTVPLVTFDLGVTF